MITKIDAIHSLRPNTQWVMVDENVASMIWHTEGVKPLTEAEVADEISRLQQVAIDKAAADATATAAAIAHAKSLGFTDAMIAVMYPNLGAQSE
jgi:hypothetical protein